MTILYGRSSVLSCRSHEPTSQSLMGNHVPSQLKSRNSRHPAKGHGLDKFRQILASNSTYTGDTKVAAEIEHIRRLIAHPVASFVLPSASAPVSPAAVLAGVTL